MPPQTFIKGATTMAAAAWSGAGFGDAAELVVGEGPSIIVDGLDQLAATTDSTGGINYLQIMEGFLNGRIGSAGSPLKFEVDGGSYTSKANVLIRGGSEIHLHTEQQAVPLTVIDAPGCTVTLHAGTWTKVILIRGTLIKETGATITTLIMEGGEFRDRKSGNRITNFKASGGVSKHYQIPTNYDISNATATLEEAGGTASTTGEVWAGGRVIARAGDLPTFIGHGGGAIDFDPIEDITAGGTSFEAYGSFRIGNRYHSQVTLTIANPDGLTGAGAGLGAGGIGAA